MFPKKSGTISVVNWFRIFPGRETSFCVVGFFRDQMFRTEMLPSLFTQTVLLQQLFLPRVLDLKVISRKIKKKIVGHKHCHPIGK